MMLSRLPLILFARRRIMLAVMVMTVALTLLVGALRPRSYTASAAVLLNYQGQDAAAGNGLPRQPPPGYSATQVELISSRNVAARVVDQLDLVHNAALAQRYRAAADAGGGARAWLAALLLRHLDVLPSRAGSVLEISFSWGDPGSAATIANAFARQYQQLSNELIAGPLNKALASFGAQSLSLRDNLAQAQRRLAAYRQQSGVASLAPQLEIETARLQALSAQLAAAQRQAQDAAARRDLARGGIAPEASPVMRQLRLQLAGAEARLARVGGRLGRKHPRYLSARAEAGRINALLGSQARWSADRLGSHALILQQREAAARTALAAQEARLLAVQRVRDELGVLDQDVAGAQRAFDAAAQRFATSRTEGASGQAGVLLLTPAVAPLRAAAAPVLPATLWALLLGSVLGLGLALLAEALDRRVRAAADIAALLRVPVFGVIGWKASRRARHG